MKQLNPKEVTKPGEYTKADIERFKREIKGWEADLLAKQHVDEKNKFQIANIQNSIRMKISEVNNRILANKAELVDLHYDHANKVTLTKLTNMLEANQAEEARIKRNIEARKKTVEQHEKSKVQPAENIKC